MAGGWCRRIVTVALAAARSRPSKTLYASSRVVLLESNFRFQYSCHPPVIPRL